MPAGHVGVFCQNLGITAYTLENYSNFKSNFLFNNGSVLEIHDFFRTRENASFNNLCQLINALSNEDFDELDKFKLRQTLGKLKEMRAQFVKVNMNYRNESKLSEFLSSPFSPGNTSLPLAATENASLTLKKRESLLENKLQAKSEKISSLQGTVSLLNKCIIEESQGRLKTDKELQVLSKDLKKQMKENKSLSLRLCQKKDILKKLNTRNINKKLNRKKVLNNRLKSENKEVRYKLASNLENLEEQATKLQKCIAENGILKKNFVITKQKQESWKLIK